MKILGVTAVFMLGCLVCVCGTHFEIHSKTIGGACILMDIDATFHLTYTEDNHTKVSHMFDLKHSSVTGESSQCGNVVFGTTAVLSVKLFPSGEMLMFRFNRQNNKVDTSMRFMLDAKKHFKDMNSTLPVQLEEEKPLPLGTDTPNSYKCFSEETVTFKTNNNFELAMKITNLHVQAYRIHNSVFGPVIECNQDFATSTLKAQTTIEPQNTTTSELPTTEPTTETTTEPSVITTTEPHTNLTSEPVPETTSNSIPDTSTNPEPETSTTPEPETSTTLEKSTTPEPETSSASEKTATPEPETTTTNIPKTTTERPNNHKYVARDNKEVCIVLQGNITFEIPYQKNDGSNSKASVDVPYEVNVSGNCSYSSTSQEIKLVFFNSTWMLEIVIAKGSKSVVQNTELFQISSDATDYSWQSVTLTYVIDGHFNDAKETGKPFTVKAGLAAFGKFAAGTDGSYKCNAKQQLDFGKDKKVEMDLSNMQYRAFGRTNSTDFSNSGVSKCPADNTNGGGGGSDHKTLGIALGCAFAGLVVIVFVACGVTRYRKRKQEMGPYDAIN